MRKRNIAIASIAAAAVAVGGTTIAVAGSGTLTDDGRVVKPGSLDDGKDLLPQTTISLERAVADAQRATSGAVGQVDLEHLGSRIVYKVDVGDKEVRVDAANGDIAAIGPQS